MHRDHKLGLALGVLVVGFAAALCFPKQTDIDQRLLQLENTAELDADIARLPVHAYTDADLPAPTPAPAEETLAPAPATVFGPLAAAPESGEFELLAGPPAPINTAPPPVTASENGNLDHEFPATAAGAVREKSSGAVHHVVRPGDTLSSLAAIHLGNHSRYLELFEANREILATPDDLRPGMVLVIPGVDPKSQLILPKEDATVAAPQLVVPDVATEATPIHAPASDERLRLFRPVRSQSFLKTQPVSRDTAAPSLPTMDASDSSRTPDATARDDAASYTVRAGDTLEAIAVRAYGDARRVDELLKANRETVRDPRRLRPGMKLTLPAAH